LPLDGLARARRAPRRGPCPAPRRALRRRAVALALLAGGLGIAAGGLPFGASAQETADAVATPGPRRVRVAVLPFRVHMPTPRPGLVEELSRRLADVLAADPRVEVIGLEEAARAARAEGVRAEVEAADERLRSIARRLEVQAVVSASLTELAGRYSVDVRVLPAAPGGRATTLADTASGREQLLERLDEVADRVAARVAGGGEGPVLSVDLEGADDLAGALRQRLATRAGLAFDPERAREDVRRLEEHPEVATVEIETERGPDGVRVRFRIVRSEQLFGGPGGLEGVGDRVADVRVRGNRRIDTDAILSRVRTSPDRPLRPAQVAADVRAVFELGFFRDVRVYAEETPEGRVLTFEVEENPVVRQIAVSGNDSVDGDKIRDALTLTAGSTLDYPLLHENTQRIEALFRAEGFYLAEVGYEIQPLAEGSVAVDFQIDEGEKLKLRRIGFQGNEAFEDDELTEDFATRRWRFWSPVTSWFDKSGTYSEPVFLRDLRQVEKKYTDAGYLQVDVGEPQVEADEEGLYVTVPIQEGPRFRVGEIRVVGDESVDLETLREKLELEQGEIFNRSHLTRDVESLETHYTDRGFYFADVQPLTDLDAEARTVDVEFRVEKGPLYFIRSIDIAGNTRTVDEVIRREMRAVEGQLYSARAVQVSNRRIRRLGYFEDVAFEPQPTEDPSQLDLNLDVVERPTGSFSFGAGFSSQDSFIFTASLSEQNLFGLGYSVNLSADIGGRSSRYFLSFNDPYFLGSTFSLGSTLFLTSVRFEDFEQEQRGFDVSLGHALTEDNTARGTLRYSFSERKITRSTGVNAAGVIFRELLQGNESSSIVGVAFRSDTRNDRFAPTSGMAYGATLEYAGLGGFANFLRVEGRWSWFLGAPDWLLPRSTFVVGTRVGWVVPFNDVSDFEFQELADVPGCAEPGQCVNVAPLDQIDTDIELPLTERYFLGGIGTFQLRGFEARSVGPRRAILRRTGLVGTGDLFLPVGAEVRTNPDDGSLVAVCNDTTINGFNPNQGNGNNRCNDLDDEDIGDFEDLDETDVIGGNKFIASTVEYRFPISEEVGLQGVLFADAGNAFAEGDLMFDPADWRYGYGAGVLWFSPFGPLQLVLGFPVDPLPDEQSPVFEFSVGGFGF